MSLLKAAAKPLGLLGPTVASSLIDGLIHKKIGSDNHAILIISNDDMNDILKIVKSLEDSGLFIDGTTETVKMKLKSKKVVFHQCF